MATPSIPKIQRLFQQLYVFGDSLTSYGDYAAYLQKTVLAAKSQSRSAGKKEQTSSRIRPTMPPAAGETRSPISTAGRAFSDAAAELRFASGRLQGSGSATRANDYEQQFIAASTLTYANY